MTKALIRPVSWKIRRMREVLDRPALARLTRIARAAEQEPGPA
jgi:hypothetical protein